MNLALECYPCILRQAVSAIGLGELDDTLGKRLMDETMTDLLNRSESESPQTAIVRMYERIERLLPGRETPLDLFSTIKKESNATAMQYFNYLESFVDSAPSPLEEGVRKAAAGNIIDFGALAHGNVDIETEIRNIPSLRFSVYDFQPLKERLAGTKTLLYIGDNTGEIVFDRVFIRRLKRDFPEIRVVFATRSRPVLNDATVEDAHDVGLDQEAEIISSGCGLPGVVLDKTTAQFQDLFSSADLIIAKGQGNYEGLIDVHDDRLFCILRIKCRRVGMDVGAPVGALVLRQKAHSE
jgi:uncharacterized protein with ATP-grasp and redox domains